MKVEFNNISISNATKHQPNFKGLYTPDKIKAFEKLVNQYKSTNPYLSGLDIFRMRESIESFNAFYKGTKSLNVDKITNEIYRKYKIPCDFKGDKIIAGCSALTANIFHKLKLVKPTSISKNRMDIDALGTCNPQNRSVGFAFDHNWENIQEEAILAKLCNHSSTGHFLKTFIHEFMHSVHVNNLYKLGQKTNIVNNPYGQRLKLIQQNPVLVSKALVDGAKPFTKGNAQNYIMQKVSNYGSTKPVEMYAEIGTEMITSVLDKKTILPKRDPFVFKNFTEDKFLMSVMDDFWNGNFEKYINK